MDAPRPRSNALPFPSHRRGERRLAALVAALATLLLLATEPQVGVTWDEPDYIVAAESYSAWFGLLLRDPGAASTREAIDDLRFAGPAEIPSLFDPQIVTVDVAYRQADWVVFQHRQTTLQDKGAAHPILRWMEQRRPALEVRCGDVPLISVYQNHRR